MYQLNPKAELQRGFRIPKGTSVERYIRDRLYYPDMLTSDRVMVATVGHESYGLNVLSSVILESLLDGQDEAETVGRIVSLFEQEPEQVERDYRETVEELRASGIIVKEESGNVT